MKKVFIPCLLLGSVPTMALADVSAKPWTQGWQFGAGVPLVLPMSSVNAFVGYANKKSDSFWGKRIGARLSADIPVGLNGTARIYDNGYGDGGYKVDASAKWGFIKVNFNDLADIDPLDFDDRPIEGIADINGKLTLKNQNVGAMIDFYPFGDTWFLGGIRLSGGYYFGKADMEIAANFPRDVSYIYNLDNDAGNMFFRIKNGSKAAAKFSWKYNGPYAGLGFDLGMFRGLKFYMDAGVVFAKPPKFSRQKNITHPTLQACFSTNSSECGEFRTVMDAAGNKPDITDIAPKIAADMLQQKKSDFVGQYPEIEQAFANYGQDVDRIANDLLNFFQGADVDWIDDFLANNDAGRDIADAIEEVRNTWSSDILDLQQDIDDAWADYDKAFVDINDSLKDFQFMPMIKIGVMYRF